MFQVYLFRRKKKKRCHLWCHSRSTNGIPVEWISFLQSWDWASSWLNTEILSLSVLPSGTKSPWSHSHLTSKENPTHKLIPRNDPSLRSKRKNLAEFRNCLSFSSLLSATSHPIPKSCHECFSMISLLPVKICCSLLRETGEQHEFTWNFFCFFYNFSLVEFLPFVLLCTFITIWFNCIALLYPSVEAKHAGNERQHVAFWNL